MNISYKGDRDDTIGPEELKPTGLYLGRDKHDVAMGVFLCVKAEDGEPNLLVKLDNGQLYGLDAFPTTRYVGIKHSLHLHCKDPALS